MQDVSKNSYWYLAFNFCRIGLFSIGTIIISRTLGPTDFGKFSYLLSIFIYTFAIDSMCHESVIKKDFIESKSDSQVGEILGTASFLGLLLAAVAAFLIVTFGLFILEDQSLFWALLLFLPGVLNKPFMPISQLLDSRFLSKYSSFALLSATLVSMFFRLVSLFFSNEVAWQTLGYSFQTAVVAVVLLFLYRRFGYKYQWSVNTSLLQSILKRSSPIFVSSVLFSSLALSDVFLLERFFSHTEVGYYAVVTRLCEPWVIISSAMCVSFFPLVFQNKSNLEKQRAILVQANSSSYLIVLLLGIPLTLTIDWIVHLLLGPNYAPSAAIFKVYFWSVLFLYLANVQHIWEVSVEKYHLLLFRTAFASLVKIGLNLYLGKKYGPYGFAFSTLVAYFAYGMGFNVFTRQTREYLKIQIEGLQPAHLKASAEFFYRKGFAWKRK